MRDGDVYLSKSSQLVLGIQPGDTEFYNPMSPEVFDAVDAVYDAVAANDWEACAAYVRGMVDQIQR